MRVKIIFIKVGNIIWYYYEIMWEEIYIGDVVLFWKNKMFLILEINVKKFMYYNKIEKYSSMDVLIWCK